MGCYNPHLISFVIEKKIS